MSGAIAINALRDRIRQIEAPARHGVLPFGVMTIDRALPQGGLALGAVHEISGAGGDEEDGAAAAGFIAAILARLRPSQGGGPILWCLRGRDLYGPGLSAHGLDPARLVVVAARREEDLLWAVEEGLRTPELAAVIGEIGRLPMVAGRRLQLAAERSGVTGFLLRRWRDADVATAERTRASAAVSRWRITALPSAPLQQHPLPRSGGGEGGHRAERWEIGRLRWRVELLRVRGGLPAEWDVEVADATGHVSLSAELADRPAAPSERTERPVDRRQWRRAG